MIKISTFDLCIRTIAVINSASQLKQNE